MNFRKFPRPDQRGRGRQQAKASGQQKFKLADASAATTAVIQVVGDQLVKCIATSSRPEIHLNVQPELAKFTAQLVQEVAKAVNPDVEVRLIPLSFADLLVEKQRAKPSEAKKFDPLLKWLEEKSLAKLRAEDRPLRVMIENPQALQAPTAVEFTRDLSGRITKATKKLQ